VRVPRDAGPESLSVFFPAYNDAPSLPDLIADAFAVLERLGSRFEVIVIDDGSRDKTPEVLTWLQRRYGNRLRVITHPENRGYGAAVRSGLEAARNDLVFYTDGDGQYDVRELPKLLERMGPDVGLVNGYKLERQDPRHRILIGSLYNGFARRLFGIRIRDVDCDYRLIRGSVLRHLRLRSTSGTICVELVRNLELTGWAVEEVGVRHYPRRHGRSQFFRMRSLAVTLCQLLGLYARLVLSPALLRRGAA
jgi:glycosyltransferase involved in cell wall biosynthesis